MQEGNHLLTPPQPTPDFSWVSSSVCTSKAVRVDAPHGLFPRAADAPCGARFAAGAQAAPTCSRLRTLWRHLAHALLCLLHLVSLAYIPRSGIIRSGDFRNCLCSWYSV